MEKNEFTRSLFNFVAIWELAEMFCVCICLFIIGCFFLEFDSEVNKRSLLIVGHILSEIVIWGGIKYNYAQYNKGSGNKLASILPSI